MLVTGASSGIGRATALALGAEGASVVAAAPPALPARRDGERDRDAGGRAVAVTGDVRDEATGPRVGERPR